MEVALTIIAALLALSNTQDIAYPADHGIQLKVNNRFPLISPARCPPNQLLYPGHHNGSWICDCKPGFIYYPTVDGCFKPYRQGPCDANQYLILPKDKGIPECVHNPCQNDGFVQYKGKCYELEKREPCKGDYAVFGVNPTTFTVQCLWSDTVLDSL